MERTEDALTGLVVGVDEGEFRAAGDAAATELAGTTDEPVMVIVLTGDDLRSEVFLTGVGVRGVGLPDASVSMALARVADKIAPTDVAPTATVLAVPTKVVVGGAIEVGILTVSTGASAGA